MAGVATSQEIYHRLLEPSSPCDSEEYCSDESITDPVVIDFCSDIWEELRYDREHDDDDSRRLVQPGCEKPNSKGQCYVGMPEDENEDTEKTTDNENNTDEFFASGNFFN